MIRDRNMQLLVSSNKEPITPFISKIRALYHQLDVSSILVVGGCGAYFQVADNVIMMDNYLPRNLTKRAKEIANSNEFQTNSGMQTNNGNNNNNNNNNSNPNGTECKENQNLIIEFRNFGDISERFPVPQTIDARANRGTIKMKIQDKFKIGFGRNDIDLSSVAQIVEKGQTKAIAKCLVYLAQNICRNGQNSVCMREIMNELDKNVLNGLDKLNNVQNAMYSNDLSPDLVRPRKYEIVAALNRLRTLKVHTMTRNNSNNTNNNNSSNTNARFNVTNDINMGTSGTTNSNNATNVGYFEQVGFRPRVEHRQEQIQQPQQSLQSQQQQQPQPQAQPQQTQQQQQQRVNHYYMHFFSQNPPKPPCLLAFELYP